MYKHSEISFSYPIARGSPILILLFITPLLLGDQISFLNNIGALILISGIFFLIFSFLKLIDIKGFSGSFKKYDLISKIIPVCFAFIFSLSGAVGPILGQNYGAKEWRRIKRAMLDAHKVNLLFCILISIILLMCSNLLIYSFNMSGQAADIIDFF